MVLHGPDGEGATVRLTFLGVRGSTPAPGAQYAGFGGHTSCVAVAAGPDSPVELVLDAGTGLRSLTELLAGEPFRGSILLSHLHWDHVQGIPFCAAADRLDAVVELFLPAQQGRSAEDLLAQQMAPPAFPITPAGLLGDWTFTGVEPGSFQAGRFSVRAEHVSHKGGVTLGYRVERGGASVAYLPDHAPKVGVGDQALAMLADVDVLIHDAQFLDHERPRAESYGHATVQDAIALARQVRARHLVLFHHSPVRTDEGLDEIAAAFCGVDQEGLTITIASQGQQLDVC